MKQQSQVNSEDVHGHLGRETKEEKKSEKDEFLVFVERQKEKGKIEVN